MVPTSKVHPDPNVTRASGAQLGLPTPRTPGTYQVQLVTLNPLGPATSLLLALLHTLELVPVPAHCGLRSQKPRLSVWSQQPLGAGGGAAPTWRIQGALKSISLQKICSLILLVHHVLLSKQANRF